MPAAPPPLPAPAPAPAPTAAPAPGRRRGRLFWPLQVLPPLLLVLLLLTDNGPGFHFMLAPLFLVLVASLLSVLVRLGLLVFGRGDPARLLRPLLAIAIVLAATAYVTRSLSEVRAAGTREAQRLQAACTAAGRCPETVDFGEGDPGHNRRWLGTPSTHLRWSLIYYLDDEGFVLDLGLGIDSTIRWTGGPARPLRMYAVNDNTETELRLEDSGVPRVDHDERGGDD